MDYSLAHGGVSLISKRAPPLEAPTVQDALKCARPVANEVGDALFSGSNITLHKFMIYVSVPCLGLTIVSSLFLVWKHLHRYTAPQEQRQIIRIALLPVFYSVFNLLALIWYQYYLYIEPIAGVFEAVAVAALFLLTLEYVAPDGTDREKFFENLEGRDKKGNPIPGGSLVWFQRTWTSCLQYPLTKTFFTIIIIITQRFNVYCENSFSPKHVHLYVELADYLLIGGALGACIKFIMRFRHEGVDPKHRMRAKAWSFIGILIFQILQDLIFHILNGKFFKPGKTATFNDINFGIPSFLTCIEAVIFSVIFQWSYSSSEYKESERLDRLGRGKATRQRTFRAILDAMNISDIVAGTFLAFQLLFMRVNSRYGGSGPDAPKREPNMNPDDQTHFMPLADRSRMRAYSNGSNNGSQDSLHAQTAYKPGNAAPAYPSAARDPSPPNRVRTFRADGLRPPLQSSAGYQRISDSGDASFANAYPQHDPRSMV